MRKNWQLGFFALFSFFAVPGFISGNWLFLTWLAWLVWLIYFIPQKKKK